MVTVVWILLATCNTAWKCIGVQRAPTRCNFLFRRSWRALYPTALGNSLSESYSLGRIYCFEVMQSKFVPDVLVLHHILAYTSSSPRRTLNASCKAYSVLTIVSTRLFVSSGPAQCSQCSHIARCAIKHLMTVLPLPDYQSCRIPTPALLLYPMSNSHRASKNPASAYVRRFPEGGFSRTRQVCRIRALGFLKTITSPDQLK